ncbi:MAG: PHP domain-containing protein [Clostridia bacterium]|nr:PHP domain-containing protein [Clostridia bacterium]
MKKYIISPKLNWYRANLHCHTTVSDGHFSPEEIKNVYKEMGYSVVAYSDHELIRDHSDLSDNEFLAITSSEFSIDDDKASFSLPSGEETEEWFARKVIHLGVYSKDPHGIFHPATDNTLFDRWWRAQGRDIGEIACDDYHREYTVDSINEMVRRLNEKGFLVSLNHPNWSLNDMNDYLNIKGLWSLEILNYATDKATGAEYCPYIYDHMVRMGNYSLCCHMGDDNHNTDGSLEDSFGGSTFIGASELEYGKIMEALENGNFYCASGKNPPTINELYVEDNIIKIDCSPATDIIITGLGRNYCHQPTQGKEITHAEFKLEQKDIMFRVTVRDKFGNTAHTRYYRVDDFITKE